MGPDTTPQLRNSEAATDQTREHTHSELWKWAQSWPACCFVCDVLNAQHTKQSPTLFYVGRRPCTYATVLGVVVSATTYDTRSVISVDDGSGVIECIQLDKQNYRSKFEHRPYPYTPDTPENCLQAESRGEVGWIVSLVGKIVPYRDTVQLLTDRMDRVLDFDQEPAHWSRVLKAHREDYQVSDKFQPTEYRAGKSRVVPVEQTPTRSSLCEPTSPSSPPAETEQPPDKLLSHPRRLSSRHLTLSTFRIYIKYYLEMVSPSPSCIVTAPQSPSTTGQNSELPEGFTISHLRRVPELHSLASRIVKGAYKAQYREQARSARSATQSCQRRSDTSEMFPNKSLNVTPSLPDDRYLRRKIKILFLRTIQELYRDGAIILAPGGSHRIHTRNSRFLPDTPHIWKETKATRFEVKSCGDLDTICPTGSGPEEEFSGPDDNEDAYIPLTRELLCIKIIDTMKAMHYASKEMRLKVAIPGDSPIYDGKCRPPSPGEIANWLTREEEWRQVGELVVLDALQLLRELEVVHQKPHGRWQISADYLRNERKLNLSG